MDFVPAISYTAFMPLNFQLTRSTRSMLVICLLLLCTQLQADTLLIRGGTLIDMTGSRPLRNANILVRDGVIEQVSSGEDVEYPADTRIIEAKGKFILPGLIDSHVHYNWYMGELFLAHGITTVADLGTRPHWQKAVRNGLNSGKLHGPRFVYCARVSNTDPAQAQQAVARLLEAADCIRFDTGAPADVTLTFTNAAEAAGTAVIAHSYDAVESARVGIDGIEHLEGVALATIRNEAGRQAVAGLTLGEGHKNSLLYQYMEPSLFDEVIARLIEANVYLNPTLIHEWKGVIDRTAQFESEEMRLLAHPSLQYIPMDEKLVSFNQYHWADAALAQTDTDAEVSVFMNNSYLMQTRSLRTQLEQGYQNVQQFLLRFVKAGGKLYSGTDTAAASIPGISLHHEMQLLADAGLSNEEVLASSTRWAAELLHIDDRLGTIGPGKQADILILGADPLKDIANTRSIEQVILAGEVVDTTYHADYAAPFRQHGPVTKHLYHQPPVITAISPGAARQHSETTVTISGENFVPSSVVLFNGVAVRTEWVNLRELKAVLGQRETTQPGSYLIGVSTPAPGGGRIERHEFIIDYPEQE